jgi:ABC-2 type transport system permease protein
MWLWGGVMFFLLFVLLGVPIRGSFVVLAIATSIFIVSYEAMAVLFVVLFDNMRLALSVGGGYSVLSFSFSGVTFPAMAMYAPIRIVGNLFPFTFYMKSYVDLVVRGVPVGYTLVNMAMMMLFGLLPLVALPRLKRMCRDEKFWGKI